MIFLLQVFLTEIAYQTLVTNMGGLKVLPGNYGYSSEVSGVISFAGGINMIGLMLMMNLWLAVKEM